MPGVTRQRLGCGSHHSCQPLAGFLPLDKALHASWAGAEQAGVVAPCLSPVGFPLLRCPGSSPRLQRAGSPSIKVRRFSIPVLRPRRGGATGLPAWFPLRGPGSA